MQLDNPEARQYEAEERMFLGAIILMATAATAIVISIISLVRAGAELVQGMNQ